MTLNNLAIILLEVKIRIPGPMTSLSVEVLGQARRPLYIIFYFGRAL